MNNRASAILASLAVVSAILLLGALMRPPISAGRPDDGSAFPQLTPSVTPCPPPTPEALSVDPVPPSTNLLTHTLTVYIGRGRLVRVIGEGGAAEATAVADVAAVAAPLKPRVANNLEVEAEVYAPGGPGGCVYNYTLRTRFDRNGAPLRVLQVEPTLRLPVVER